MIYLATSWRNEYFEGVVDCFQQWNVPIYNFRDDNGFSWSEIDPFPWTWNKYRYKEYLTTHPRAIDGFKKDKDVLQNCRGLLLITPCGRSAHLELGYVAGLGKPTAIYLKEDQDPELMYKLADEVLLDIDDVHQWARVTISDIKRI